MLAAVRGKLTDVHDSALNTVGSRYNANQKEYIYLKGVASTVAGSWARFDENFATTLIVADAVGPVAVALAAIVANKYGWYQIYGVCTVASTDTIAADLPLYIDGTAGRADDAVVAGDMIMGAISMTADTSNVATVFLNYPYITNTLG